MTDASVSPIGRRVRGVAMAAFAGLVATACATKTTTTVVRDPTPQRPARVHEDDGEPVAAAPFSVQERERINLVQPWVAQASAEHDLDPNLINGMIWVESRFDPKARSHAGARGLMQLMPATASAMARKLGSVRARSYDPEFNVAAGTLYLARLLERYDGDEALALAAYNAGAGNVDKWLAQDGELPPVSRRYVELVMDARARFAALREGPAARTDTMLAERAVPPIVHVGQRPEPTPREVEQEQYVPEPPRQAEPPPVRTEYPVRYDLDRVESTYEPTPAAEPPLKDTPWPPIEPAPEPEPEPASQDEGEPASVLPSDGLPSVLD